MTVSNRLAMTPAAAAVSVTLASGCTAAGGVHHASSPSGPGTATASFSAMGLAFRYPAAWRLGRWNADGFPFSHPPEPNTTIAGRKAIETRSTGGWCATLRGTETITVKILRSVPDNWYEMDACLRTPGLARQEAEIASMLSSVRIANGY